MGRAIRGTCASLLASIVLAAPPAAAQPGAQPRAQDERETQRTELYKQAVQMANAGRWADAAATLQAVLAIRSSPKVRFTLGQAQEHIGQIAEAYDTFGRVAADATAAGEPNVANLATSAQHAMELRVPTLRVVVGGTNGAGAAPTIDDRVVVAGQQVRVDPGTHKVAVVDAPGHVSTTNVTVREGDHVDVPFRLGGESPAPGARPASAPAAAQPDASSRLAPPASDDQSDPESPPSSRLGGLRVAALAAGGVGIVGLGIGAYFGFDAISKNNASNSAGCNSSTAVCPNQSALDTRNAAKSSATASTIAFAAGGVLLAGGITLWFLAPRGEAAVQIGPTAYAGGAGVTVSGVWR